MSHGQCESVTSSLGRKVVYRASGVPEFREHFRVEGQNVKAEVERVISEIERN